MSNKKFRIIFLFTLAVIIACVGLTGCGASETPPLINPADTTITNPEDAYTSGLPTGVSVNQDGDYETDERELASSGSADVPGGGGSRVHNLVFVQPAGTNASNAANGTTPARPPLGPVWEGSTPVNAGELLFVVNELHDYRAAIETLHRQYASSGNRTSVAFLETQAALLAEYGL